MLDVGEANDLRLTSRDRAREWTQRIDNEFRDDSMLDSILGAVFELARQPLVLDLSRPACDGSGHRLREGSVTRAADQQLR